MATSPNTSRTTTPHILIVGGGYAGMYTALRLRRRIRRGEATITVVDPHSHMTYQPFLPEVAAGHLAARHVVVPLRRVLPHARVLNGRVVSIDHASRVAAVRPAHGPAIDVRYDHLVLTAGSVSRTLPIPGLAVHGIGFKNVAEAFHLRNHVLAQLDVAASTTDPRARRRALTFVFVGGGFAGVEALAELEDMARGALRYYPDLAPGDMRWVLVEAADGILPEVGERMGRYTLDELRRRGVDVRLHTRLTSAVDHRIELDDGTAFEAGTLVWTAGVRPSPLTRATDLPRDRQGRIVATEYLTVDGVPDAFAAGDCAAVPDLTRPGELCAPSAQHAVRQARRLADNLVATLRGRRLRPYRHSHAGSVAGLGLYRGVGHVYGVRLRGFAAWFMHRAYHLSRVPTWNRKVRVMADWTLALFFRRETVALGGIDRPRAEFELASRHDQAA